MFPAGTAASFLSVKALVPRDRAGTKIKGQNENQLHRSSRLNATFSFRQLRAGGRATMQSFSIKPVARKARSLVCTLATGLLALVISGPLQAVADEAKGGPANEPGRR